MPLRNPALAQVLPAMTAQQALIALCTFSVAVLAPRIGISVQQLGLLHALLFGTGAASALAAGWLIQRLGDLRLAALCLLVTALAMGALLVASATGLLALAVWPVFLLLGLAFGPETPASASVLARVTPPAERPWVYSVRQTGNQIGAAAGSLLLPLLLAWHAELPWLAAGVLALGGAWWCRTLAHKAGLRAAPVSPAEASTPDAAAAPQGSVLAQIRDSRLLRALAFACLAYSALQMCLNTFLISHAVQHWGWPLTRAAAMAALMQAGGLVGRLGWGWWARRQLARGGQGSARLLGWLGFGMAACGAVLLWAPELAPGNSGGPAHWLAALLLGLSASGWNGVLIAEVSRIAGPARAGALSGAVLMFGYAGLALAPLGFALAAGGAGTLAAYTLLLVLTAAAGPGLLRAGRTRVPMA